MDQDLADMLRELEASGELNRTVLVLTSDHGSHMGPYYMSGAMGEFEQRLPMLFMSYPRWFLDKYPEFRSNLQSQEQVIISHYDTYWTLRHLSTLPEFGGSSANHETDANPVVDVLDCVRNRDYMEVAYQFRNYIFTRAVGVPRTVAVMDLISTCFRQLDYEPRVLNRSLVPLEMIATSNHDVNKPFVESVITDKFAYYWFLDAVKYIELMDLKHGFRPSLPNERDLEAAIEGELRSWETLSAPGQGRYLFGRSLLKYSDHRTCKAAGIPVCPCTRPRPNNLRGAN